MSEIVATKAKSLRIVKNSSLSLSLSHFLSLGTWRSCREGEEEKNGSKRTVDDDKADFRVKRRLSSGWLKPGTVIYK